MVFVGQLFVFLTGLFHVLFFILESIIFKSSMGQKIFKISLEQAEMTKVWAANQGVYNLLLAFGLFWSLIASRSDSAIGVRIYILLFIVACGSYGAFSVGKTVFFFQLIPALIALLCTLMSLSIPMINDIVTDMETPLKFNEIQRLNTTGDYNYDENFKKLQKKYYPKITPMLIKRGRNETFLLIKKVIQKNENWSLVSEHQGTWEFEFFEKTKFLGFRDDIIVKVEALSEDVSTIQVRSKSQKGHSDFGVNAKRILEFFESIKFEAAIIQAN